MRFTKEEEKELKHLGNVLKYAKPKKRNKAQEKLFDFMNERIETEIERHIKESGKELFSSFEKEFKKDCLKFHT